MERLLALFSPALLLVVFTGGTVGILGAVFTEVTRTSLLGLFLAPFVAAPIIEETLKPCGVYLLLSKWPRMLRGQFHIAFLSGLSGLWFAVAENLIYIFVYVPDHTPAFVVYRFTGPLAMHTLASFILGFGINQRLIASVKGEIPLLAGNRKFFIVAMTLHSLYNIAAVVLAATVFQDTFLNRPR